MGFLAFIASFSISLFLFRTVFKKISKKKEEPEQFVISKPFIVSEYYERMEKAMLDILEEQENKETYLITLWFGLNGIRINEDDTLEWISRKKPEPVNQNVYQTCQVNSIAYGMQQCIQTPHSVMNWMSIQNAIQSQFTPCQVPPPAWSQYSMGGYLNQINGCCCDRFMQ